MEQSHGQQTHGQLNQRILPGNGALTVTAFPSEDDKAQQGDIVIPFERGLTLGTMGRRIDNGLARLGNAENRHIKKAADHDSEKKGYEKARI